MDKGTTYVALDDSKRRIVAGILRPADTERSCARSRTTPSTSDACGRPVLPFAGRSLVSREPTPAESPPLPLRDLTAGATPAVIRSTVRHTVDTS
jgi:hypothetical protein